MRAHQVDLKFAYLMARDAHLAELAHARGDGVRNLIAGHQFFDHGASAIHRLACIGRQKHRLMVDGNLAHGFEGEIVSVNVESLHSDRPLAASESGCEKLLASRYRLITPAAAGIS